MVVGKGGHEVAHLPVLGLSPLLYVHSQTLIGYGQIVQCPLCLHTSLRGAGGKEGGERGESKGRGKKRKRNRGVVGREREGDRWRGGSRRGLGERGEEGERI